MARAARYQQLGEVSAAARQLWLVAHGYGQLPTLYGALLRQLHATPTTQPATGQPR